MRLSLTLVLGAVCFGLLSGEATLPSPQDRAQALLAEAKQAAGGEAWDRLKGWHERGRHTVGDVSYAYETWLDLHHLSMAVRARHEGKTRLSGFNGATAWRIEEDGKLIKLDSDVALKAERESAYVSAFGFFFPDRFPAKAEWLGERTVLGAEVDVVEVTPDQALGFEVWIDRKTHLITRIVDRNGAAPVQVDASDFRSVDGALIPFHLIQTNGDSRHAEDGQVLEIRNEPVDPAVFELPKITPAQ